jgi:hypothetical protein
MWQNTRAREPDAPIENPAVNIDGIEGVGNLFPRNTISQVY